jgi:O-succinylbenzoate synthase
MVRSVRENFPDITMHVDCNSSYTLDDLSMFKELDQYNLAMIEQPLMHDDLIDHARLQSEIKTPICLDESIVSLERTRQAIELNACGWINIKVGRVGGLTNAVAIHNLCEEQNMPNWIGSMLESALGQSISLAMATLPNVKYPSDIFPSNRFYETDLAEPEIVLSGTSVVEASSEAGLGYYPKLESLDRRTIEKTVVKPIQT